MWAGRCPVCGALLPQVAAPRPQGGSVPLSSRSQPRRARWPAVVALAAGSALVVAVVAWPTFGTGSRSAAGRPHPPTPASATTLDPQLIHRTLVEAEQGRLRIFHFDGTGETDLNLPIGPSHPVSVGDAIVFVADGQALATTSPQNGTLATLGPADRLIPAVNPGQVWLVRDQSPGPVTVQLACVHGPGVQCTPLLTGLLSVPAGLRPVAPVLDNLLLENTNPQVTAPPLVWNPFANRVVFRLSGSFVEIVDTHLSQVAWRDGGQGSCTTGDQCPLHITDLGNGNGNGNDEIIPPPPDAKGYLGGGAFSPDGAYLVAFTSAPNELNKARPVIIRLGEHPEVQAVSALLDVGEPLGAAVWDPTSDLVFVSGLSGSIVACRPGDPTPTVLPIPASYAFAVL